MANWLDAFEQRGLMSATANAGQPCCMEADSDIPAVCVDHGDIQHSGIGYEPPAQPMPTTSCAMAATRA